MGKDKKKDKKKKKEKKKLKRKEREILEQLKNLKKQKRARSRHDTDSDADSDEEKDKSPKKSEDVPGPLVPGQLQGPQNKPECLSKEESESKEEKERKEVTGHSLQNPCLSQAMKIALKQSSRDAENSVVGIHSAAVTLEEYLQKQAQLRQEAKEKLEQLKPCPQCGEKHFSECPFSKASLESEAAAKAERNPNIGIGGGYKRSHDWECMKCGHFHKCKKAPSVLDTCSKCGAMYRPWG
eukprot:g59966.t1